MKTKNDPRHIRRIKIMRDLFTWEFDKDQITEDIEPIINQVTLINELIQKAAPQRPITEINKIDLSILRLSIFELIIVKSAPVKVIVDEAIEMGKEFGSDASFSFINGVLGKVIEEK